MPKSSFLTYWLRPFALALLSPLWSWEATSQAQAATLTVTTLKDTGAGSLRAAILSANRQPDADTIRFAPPVRGLLNLNSALPDLSSNITIQGPGRDRLNVRRTSKTHYRIFTISPKGHVRLNGLTLSNESVVAATGPIPRRGVGGGISNEGYVEINNCTLTGNQASEGGGGLFNNSSQGGWGMLLTRCLVTNNQCFNLQTPGELGGGGGLLNARDKGDASAKISDCVFSGNRSTCNGGAISTGPGGVYVFTSTFSDNRAKSQGGALYGAGNSGFTVAQCAFLNNQAAEGGGIYTNPSDGQVSLQNSTLSGNKATKQGGAIVAGGWGAMLNACTVVNNSAPRNAGISVSQNSRILNTILVGNLLPSGTPGMDVDIWQKADDPKFTLSHVGSGGYNLVGQGSAKSFSYFHQETDRRLVSLSELKLGPLAANGGSTKTYALLPGSPAIGKGLYIAMDGPFPDQRGVTRPSAGDIGAFQTAQRPVTQKPPAHNF